jgi:ABC-2 type transport system ATP-binding protein
MGARAHPRARATLGQAVADIELASLTKHYKVHKRASGMGAALRSLFRRRYETVKAVEELSFTIEKGERVGFLGPNGAGKTTTLKVLAGLLHPTSGTVRVVGHVPQRREVAFLKQITLVMGQKQQLLWDLPPAESFSLNRAIYDVPKAQFDETMAELYELLSLKEIATKPARQLSLGERMKCELAAALLHRPRILFLDEPTIGLDVSMQAAMREFIRSYNERHGATVLLTSHYMVDVTALCKRVIVIDHGRLVYDGDLTSLVRTVNPDKLVTLKLSRPVERADVARLGEVLEHTEAVTKLRVASDRLRDVVASAIAQLPIADLTVEDPPLEDVMRQLFAEKRTSAAS